MRSLVTSIFLYACESWTLTAKLQRRMQAMKMRCYRKTPRISCKDHVANEEVRAKIGNRITRRPPDHRKETQTAVVWTCLRFISSSRNHLAKPSDRWKKTRQTEEEMGRQHQGMDRPGVRKVPEGSGEQGKWRKLVVKSYVVSKRPSR